MRYLTSSWWRLLLVSVVSTITLGGAPLAASAQAPPTKTCIAFGIFCHNDKPDPQVDQSAFNRQTPAFRKLSHKDQQLWVKVCFMKASNTYKLMRGQCTKYFQGYKVSNLDPNVNQNASQHPTPALLKKSKSLQKWIYKQCFTTSFDWIFRSHECHKYYDGYKAKGFVNTTLPVVMDPVGAGTKVVGQKVTGWVKDQLQSLAYSEADSIRWLLVNIIASVGANGSLEPKLTVGYVTQLNDVFTWSFIIAMVAVAFGWMKATFKGSIKDAVLSTAFFVRFIFFGALALVLTWWVLKLFDQGILPAFMKSVNGSNTQALNNMTKVDMTKGIAGETLPYILPVFYLVAGVFGGLFAVFEIIVRLFMILILVPCVVVVLAVGPTNSGWADVNLKKVVLKLLGWILLPFFLGFILTLALGLMRGGQAVTGKWPVGVIASVMLFFASVLAWEGTRLFAGHDFGSGKIAQAARGAVS
jgi:hypothetical protein